MRRRRTIVAARPAANPAPAAQVQGTTGWAPFGTGAQHASSQIGAYAGTVLTQYPANLPGVQRHCVVEGLNAGYYYPTRSVVPYPERQTVQAPTRFIAGPQRAGSLRGAPSGPVNVALMQQRVQAAADAQGVNALGLPIFLTQPGAD
jgi:hypothetical protein